MLLSDRPIECGAEDQLGFQPFCAALARGLREMTPAEGMVVALHAPWGSGKTSALNLFQRHLTVLDIAALTKRDVEELVKMAAARADAPTDDERSVADQWRQLVELHSKKLKTTVLRFNPWYFSGQENLFKAFFGVLGTELEIANNSAVARAFAAILRRGEAAGMMAGAAMGMMAAGPPGAAGGGTIGGFFGKLTGDKFDQKESLESSLELLREVLKSSERRLVVVIDDIDRLLPEELRQMLMLIKSLGNLPNVTYLLAFARAEVTELIKRAGIGNQEYLQKIVQVSFELPRVDRYALQTMLFARLDSILDGSDLGDKDRWSQAFANCVDPYLRTPRDVTHLCNALQIVWPSIRGEADWTDLVVLEILRHHEPTIYETIVQNLGRLTGEMRAWSGEKDWAQSLLPKIESTKNVSSAKEALMYLFPSLTKSWEHLTIGFEQPDPEASRNRRIQSAEYAQNYFTLSPSIDQFRTAQIKNLFLAADRRQAFDDLFITAKSRSTRQRQTMVCRLLDQVKEEIPTNGLPIDLARAILSRSREIIGIRDSQNTIFEVTNDLRLSWLLIAALRALPEDQRANVAEQWFAERRGWIFLVRFISTFTHKGNDRSETIFPETEFTRLRSLAADSVRNLAKEDSFLRKLKDASLLFAWGHLTSFEEVSTELSRRLGDDRAVIELAAIMPAEVHSSPGGLSYYVDRKAWSLLLDVDAFTQRVRQLEPMLADKDKTVIDRYYAALAKDWGRS